MRGRDGGGRLAREASVGTDLTRRHRTAQRGHAPKRQRGDRRACGFRHLLLLNSPRPTNQRRPSPTHHRPPTHRPPHQSPTYPTPTHTFAHPHLRPYRLRPKTHSAACSTCCCRCCRCAEGGPRAAPSCSHVCCDSSPPRSKSIRATRLVLRMGRTRIDSVPTIIPVHTGQERTRNQVSVGPCPLARTSVLAPPSCTPLLPPPCSQLLPPCSDPPTTLLAPPTTLLAPLTTLLAPPTPRTRWFGRRGCSFSATCCGP